MQTRHHAAVRLPKWMLASTIVVPAALFVYVAAVSHQNSFRLADERIQRLLDAVDEHAVKVFESVSVVVASADAITRGRSGRQATGTSGG